MSDLDDVIDAIRALRRDLDDHKVTTRNMLRVGPVSERDHGKGVRIEHGTAERPDGSPWLQPAERSGVERDLPRKGEQVLVLAPFGDQEQGIVIPFGHSKDKANPAADADETVIFARDGLRIAAKAGTLTITSGKATWTLSASAVTAEVDGKKAVHSAEGTTFTAGKVKHDGRSIGSDHKHGGVQPGGSPTDVPV